LTRKVFMISKIYIKNFRSIKNLEFEPRNLCALVGQNNVGKSNILLAIDMLLGEQWPTYRIKAEDIYGNDDTLTVQIKIMFDSPIPHKYYGTTYEVYGLHLEYGPTTQSIYCLNEREQIITNRSGTPIYANNITRANVPCVLIEVDRDLEKELRGSQWTIFGRLLKEIEKDFTSNETRKNDYDCKMGDACSLLRTDKFNKLENSIREQVKKLTGFNNADLKFTSSDILDNYKSLKLVVKESPEFDEFSALEMGAGIKSAIFISIMEAYRQLKGEGSILIIEEPEVYLHPHARRFFYKLLKELSEQGNQIFYSTHSSEFVNLPDFESICLVRKNHIDGTTIHQLMDIDIPPGSKDELKLLTQFDVRRNEMFFAKKVLLVEGQTERFSLPYLFLLKGYDLYDKGISIIDSESKDNLEYFIKILNASNIPFVVLHDDDSDKPDYTSKHIELNQHIIDTVGDPSFVFRMDPDFEGVFNIHDKSIRNAIDCCKSINAIDNIPSVVNEAIDKLLSI
jgi:putative ATP-dependent endonuclease of the OLD family